MLRVAVVAVPPVTAFDLAIPDLVLGHTVVDGAPGYEVLVCTAQPGPIKVDGGFDIVVRHGLEMLRGADIVIVTGTGARENASPAVLSSLQQAAANGKRIASICTGAFVLAQAGLLDGRSATTYWLYSAELKDRFPSIDVRPDVLYVEDDGIFTSAGLAAGIDLCLHLVRSDYGAAVANVVARLAVVAPVRPGGQAQFIQTPVPKEEGASLASTRAWALRHLDKPLALGDLAAHASISIRSLTRNFQSETGASPLQWLLQRRLDRARELLETTDLPMDRVAEHCGLGSADSLRQHFRRRFSISPTTYRGAFSRRNHPS